MYLQIVSRAGQQTLVSNWAGATPHLGVAASAPPCSSLPPLCPLQIPAGTEFGPHSVSELAHNR